MGMHVRAGVRVCLRVCVCACVRASVCACLLTVVDCLHSV